MVRYGFHHVLEGVDHLLFLLALLLPAPLVAVAGRWRRGGGPVSTAKAVLRVVSAFTLGHSITLIAAALGWVTVPSRPVEVLIAASVGVAAVHAIRPLAARGAVILALGFGLVHGLAFAGILSDLGVDGTTSLLSLLAFNVGIELAQLTCVALVFPSLYVLSRTRFYPAFRVAGASLALAAAAGWGLDRLGLPANPFGALETVAVAHLPSIVLLLAGLAIAARLDGRPAMAPARTARRCAFPACSARRSRSRDELSRHARRQPRRRRPLGEPSALLGPCPGARRCQRRLAAVGVVRRKPGERLVQGIEHERHRQLREDLGGRRTGERPPGLAADRNVDDEPETGVFCRLIGDVVRHARTGVEVELERRAERVLQVVARIDDQLEPANRARELGVRDAGGKSLALRAWEPDGRHDLHVEVARRGVEVAERARAEEPRAHETIAQSIVQAGDQLGEVVLDVRGEHGRILAQPRPPCGARPRRVRCVWTPVRVWDAW